jgi:hypothetical protein
MEDAKMNSLRVMVFYDGNYFKQGQIYFRYKENRGWFSLSELHTSLKNTLQVKQKPQQTQPKSLRRISMMAG